MTVYHIIRMETVGSEQQLCLYIPLRNCQQRKRPCPGVLDVVSVVMAATVYPLTEMTHDCNHGNDIIILPGEMRRKVNLSKNCEEVK